MLDVSALDVYIFKLSSHMQLTFSTLWALSEHVCESMYARASSEHVFGLQW